MTIEADKLAPAVFQSYLRQGRGAALRHALAYGLGGVDDLLLQACLVNQCYDPQCETERSAWLYRMFKGSPQYDHFAKEILATLTTTSDSYDINQLCGLAALIAKDGHADAATALRRFVLGQTFSQDAEQFGCDALVLLDGMPALAELGRRFGLMLLADPTDYVPDPDYLMQGFEAQPGNLAALEQLAMHDAALSAYVENYRNDVARRVTRDQAQLQQAQRARVRQQYSVKDIIASALAGKGEFPGRYRSFGRHATDGEIEQVFQQLLATTAPAGCVRLLWIFSKTPMPRLAPRIWELADHDDAKVSSAALTALSRLRDPEVGVLGRKLIVDSTTSSCDSSVISLFARNLLPGDEALILSRLESMTISEDDEHGYSFSVLEVCNENPVASTAALAEWVYRTSPCSVCRLQAVQHLVLIGCLAPAIAAECAYDANQDIQALSVPD